MDLNISQYGWIHTALSLLALLTGVVVVWGLLTSRRMGGLTALFLASAVATSATGFGFAGGLGPAKMIGILSLVLLVVALLARYAFHLAGAWRWLYAVTAVFTLYFLVFVAIAETFKRVPSLKAAAPTLTEPPFKITQMVVLAVFVVLAILAAARFRYAREDDARG